MDNSLNLSGLADKIKNVCAEKGVGLQEALADCGASRNALCASYKGSSISTAILYKIANRLNVSLDYLTGRTTYPEVLSDDTLADFNENQELFKAMSQLSPDEKSLIKAQIEGIVNHKATVNS